MHRQFAFVELALLLTALSPAVWAQTPKAEMNTSSSVPAISIETSVPGEINIGTSARFVISVKNSGKSLAEGVSIQTTLPPTVKFVEANPNPSLTKDHLLQFDVGDLPPGTVRRIIVELLPQKTGPVDLQAKAFFSASTQSALQVRQPDLMIECGGPNTAQIGETVTFRVVVKNIGDGPAQQVVLTPQLPESSFIEGQAPQAVKIPVLAAGQSQEFKFVVRAAQRELLEGNFIAKAQGTREVQCSHQVKVLVPDLRVELTGTRVGFVGSEGEYALRTWNPGDTVLRSVRVALQVPEGLEVTTLSEQASIDRENRIYTWCLPSLEPGDSHTIQLKAKAAKVGRQLQQVVTVTDTPLRAQGSHLTHVISRADVEVSVNNAKEAIEVGVAEQLTVVVVNHGSRMAESVAVTVQLPEGIQAVATDGATTADQQVQFPAFRLKPAESKTLTFRVVGLTAGDHAIRASVATDFASLPTIAETLVYCFDTEELDRIARQLDAGVIVR
jgi:uncharacterized repeat protein (TIGR01451 family)